MRLHTLQLQAFGPYATQQRIDFGRLAASGLFLLEGPTGAGKSTILDAVTFALYGGLAGEESGEDRLRSHFAGPAAEQDRRITETFEREQPRLRSFIRRRVADSRDAEDILQEVFTELVEDPDPNCPFGAKEVGQGPLLPVMPAVANAVYDAIGVRIDELPITPDKVLAALEKKARGEAPRFGPESFPDVPYPEPLLVPPPWEGGDGNSVNRPRRGPVKKEALA